MTSRHESNNNGDGSVSSVDAVPTQNRPLASPQDLPIRKILPLRFGGGHFRFWIARGKKEDKRFTIVTETERKAVGSADLQEFPFSMHKDTHYKNCRFLQVQDLTASEFKIFVTYEYFPVSLAELCGSPGLDDQDIAGILKQILEGLEYIHKHSLKYLVLECSNILLDDNGEVKLWFNQFTAKSPSVTQSTTALCSILQLLMQGYEKDPPSIDNPTRWSNSTLDFFHSLVSATELTAVIQHNHLQNASAWQKRVGRHVVRALYWNRWDFREMV